MTSEDFEALFAKDEKLNYVEDHPCPWDDHLYAVVRLRLPDRRRLRLRPTHAAYEFARTGVHGVATVRGKVLERFEQRIFD